MGQFTNAADTGKALGISGEAVVKLYKDGAIPAEIAEGRLYRFDLERVRKALNDRASKRQSETEPSRYGGQAKKTS